METIRTVAELRALLAGPRREGRVIGLVPTMGAFHEGHLSLIRQARSRCDLVVVSLFVNPTQFNDPGDLAVYPRDEDEDAARAAELGVDYLFVPAIDEVYPAGFATAVSVSGLTQRLEGVARGRGHFDGVATVVTKLLNMVAPDIAYFGQKDAQQVAVIRHLVRDLNIPVEIDVCPTVRAQDGLALSSRNLLLSAAERRQATALHRALQDVQEAVRAGGRDPEAVTEAARRRLAQAGVEPEYLSVVSAQTMEPVEGVEGDVLAVIAARIGAVRLIDNVPITVTGAEGPTRTGQPTREPSDGSLSRMTMNRNIHDEVATPLRGVNHPQEA
jgi:pantoate--beta-alanine ligase